jgi:hypothetical protein
MKCAFQNVVEIKANPAPFSRVGNKRVKRRAARRSSCLRPIPRQSAASSLEFQHGSQPQFAEQLLARSFEPSDVNGFRVFSCDPSLLRDRRIGVAQFDKIECFFKSICRQHNKY